MYKSLWWCWEKKCQLTLCVVFDLDQSEYVVGSKATLLILRQVKDQTICCDGDIVDFSVVHWGLDTTDDGDWCSFILAQLVFAGVDGDFGYELGWVEIRCTSLQTVIFKSKMKAWV